MTTDTSRIFTAEQLASRLRAPLLQAKRLNDLLDRLMDVSRIRSSAIQLQLEAVDLSLLLAGVVTRFGAAAQLAKCQVEISAPESIVAYVDSFRIDQVLDNLLSNALKYGGGSKISIRLHADSECAQIEVEDRGLGIAIEDQERIFRRYERASHLHGEKSIGLGLYIISEVINAHEGRIELVSEIGKGSTFKVTLPLRLLKQSE